jgi:drug/metabolite transporter (DMT)-like permease
LHLDNKQRSLRAYLLLVWFVALRAFGNLSLAWGARHLTEDLAFSPLGYLRAMLNPYVFLGIAMLMASLLTRMALFSVADLSFVLPMTAMGYIVSVFFGRTFLHEYVSPAHWVGAILIFTAIALVSSTPPTTTPQTEEQTQPESDAVLS